MSKTANQKNSGQNETEEVPAHFDVDDGCALTYIRDLSSQLSDLSEYKKFQFLGYLLGMVVVECDKLLEESREDDN